MNNSLANRENGLGRLRRIRAVGAGVLIALGGAEIWLRVFTAMPEHIVHMPLDSELGYRMRGGVQLQNQDGQGSFQFVLNENGTRGRAMPREGQFESDDVTRALIVGDSFLTAWAVRETDLMSTVAEQRLEEQGERIDFYIAAADGYSTGQELLLLRRYAARVQPDFVVLVMFPANDVLENSLNLAGRTLWCAGDYTRPYFEPTEEGELELTWAHPWRSMLRRHSRLFAQLEIHLYLKRVKDQWGRPNPWPFERLTRRERVEAGLLAYERMELFCEQPDDSAWEKAWRVTESLLKQFNAEVRGLGAELLVLVVPAKHQVRIGAEERMIDLELSALGDSRMAGIDANLPERRLTDFFTRHDIAYRLMLEPLRQAVRREPTKDPYVLDGHLSGTGHQVAGNEIAHWIRNQQSGLENQNAQAMWRGENLTSPVDHLPMLANRGRWLDFRTGAHREFLSNGWKVWNSHSTAPGWEIEATAFAVLPPANRARLTLRGQVLNAGDSALIVRFSVPGTGMETDTRVEAPSSFELTLDLREKFGSEECVPVRIQLAQASSEATLVIEELGQSD